MPVLTPSIALQAALNRHYQQFGHAWVNKNRSIPYNIVRVMQNGKCSHMDAEYSYRRAVENARAELVMLRMFTYPKAVLIVRGRIVMRMFRNG